MICVSKRQRGLNSLLSLRVIYECRCLQMLSQNIKINACTENILRGTESKQSEENLFKE